jgi:hypothetical protein
VPYWIFALPRMFPRTSSARRPGAWDQVRQMPAPGRARRRARHGALDSDIQLRHRRRSANSLSPSTAPAAAERAYCRRRGHGSTAWATRRRHPGVQALHLSRDLSGSSRR